MTDEIIKMLEECIPYCTDKEKELFSKIILDLLEIQQYRAIGTIEEFMKVKEKMENKNKIMTIRTEDFEKSMLLLKIITNKIDFNKKFRVTIEYDPKLPAVRIYDTSINKEKAESNT